MNYDVKIFVNDQVFWVCCRCIFTGTVVVIPDIAAISAPGDRAESRRKPGDRSNRGGKACEASRPLEFEIFHTG